MFEVKKSEVLPSIVAIVIIVCLLAPIILSYLTLGRLQRSTTIGILGTVKAVGVGVYWDNNCNNRVSSINWGMAEPDSVKNVTVYIRNESNAPVTLSLQTEKWNPTNASNYIILSCSYYGGQEIGVDEVVQVTLSLGFSSSMRITNFSFDIIITGIAL